MLLRLSGRGAQERLATLRGLDASWPRRRERIVRTTSTRSWPRSLRPSRSRRKALPAPRHPLRSQGRTRRKRPRRPHRSAPGRGGAAARTARRQRRPDPPPHRRGRLRDLPRRPRGGRQRMAAYASRNGWGARSESVRGSCGKCGSRDVAAAAIAVRFSALAIVGCEARKDAQEQRDRAEGQAALAESRLQAMPSMPRPRPNVRRSSRSRASWPREPSASSRVDPAQSVELALEGGRHGTDTGGRDRAPPRPRGAPCPPRCLSGHSTGRLGPHPSAPTAPSRHSQRRPDRPHLGRRQRRATGRPGRPHGPVRSAAFSPDGAHIVTASGDQTARIWDAASGEQLAILDGHMDWVDSAAFSPDGAYVVTASGDQTARVWDARQRRATGHPARPHDRSARPPSAPTAPAVVTASDDRTARDLGRRQRRATGRPGAATRTGSARPPSAPTAPASSRQAGITPLAYTHAGTADRWRSSWRWRAPRSHELADGLGRSAAGSVGDAGVPTAGIANRVNDTESATERGTGLLRIGTARSRRSTSTSTRRSCSRSSGCCPSLRLRSERYSLRGGRRPPPGAWA